MHNRNFWGKPDGENLGALQVTLLPLEARPAPTAAEARAPEREQLDHELDEQPAEHHDYAHNEHLGSHPPHPIPKFGQSPKEQQLYFGTPSLIVMGFLQMYNSRASWEIGLLWT